MSPRHRAFSSLSFCSTVILRYSGRPFEERTTLVETTSVLLMPSGRHFEGLFLTLVLNPGQVSAALNKRILNMMRSLHDSRCGTARCSVILPQDRDGANRIAQIGSALICYAGNGVSIPTSRDSDRVSGDNEIESWQESDPVATAPGTDLIHQTRSLSVNSVASHSPMIKLVFTERARDLYARN